MTQLAPVILFAFKRPEHTRRTLEALARNPEFPASRLHVFCDGPRHEGEVAAVEATRAVIRAFPHPAKVLHESPTNKGLAASVIEGVGEVLSETDRVVVLEDDLLVGPQFLSFMNAALTAYQDAPQVFQVTGYMFPVALPGREALFLPFSSTWGWGTWRRAWQGFSGALDEARVLRGQPDQRDRFDLGGTYPYWRMLQNQLEGRIDSWGILWYVHVFLQEGLTLYPPISLVKNIGFDGTGTHSGFGLENGVTLTDEKVMMPSGDPIISQASFVTIKSYLAQQYGPVSRLIRKVRGIWK